LRLSGSSRPLRQVARGRRIGHETAVLDDRKPQRVVPAGSGEESRIVEDGSECLCRILARFDAARVLTKTEGLSRTGHIDFREVAVVEQ
jgi:hypothetical protein